MQSDTFYNDNLFNTQQYAFDNQLLCHLPILFTTHDYFNDDSEAWTTGSESSPPPLDYLSPSLEYLPSPPLNHSLDYLSPKDLYPCQKKRKPASKKLEIEKNFACDYKGCSKVFGRQEHVKRHIRSIHTKEKPFKCPYGRCQKSFARSDNLNQHIRTHRKSN